MLAIVSSISCTSVGDSTPDANYGIKYKTLRASIYNTADIEVAWADPIEVDKKCRKWAPHLRNESMLLGGCARSKPGDTDTCQIIVAEPRSFEDHLRLNLLGHEVWHCFGATHK